MTFQSFDGSRTSTDEVHHQRLLAKKLLNERLQRSDFFSRALFSEAAWDAILILFSSEPFLSCSTESLAGELDVPLTTMARWIKLLEEEGLLETKLASSLSSKMALRLSSTGRKAVQDYLRAIGSRAE